MLDIFIYYKSKKTYRRVLTEQIFSLPL